MLYYKLIKWIVLDRIIIKLSSLILKHWRAEAYFYERMSTAEDVQLLFDFLQDPEQMKVTGEPWDTM